jgi:hypothetical protein
MKRIRSTARVVATGLLAAALAGCAGYRLGGSPPPGISSIHVPAFVNNTGEPAIEARASDATLQEFQRDGTVKIAEAGQADATLQVALVAYKLVPLRYLRDRAKTTREYRLQLTADLELKRAGTGEVLLQKRVLGETTFLLEADITSAKRLALPEAARDLAHEIVESVVELW